MGRRSSDFLSRLVSGGELVIPLAFMVVLGVMLLPLPPVLLDLLLTFNVSLSLIVLLLAMYIQRPVEFSTFPSLLLILTLFRLALNVASTRLILLHGQDGESAAGHVIQAFGSFVIGGSYVVGIVVFLILVVINFAVITKGSGRIAEVAARFTLDAMPGKQLAVDAELNSGVITEKQARERRRIIEAEGDFYGSMDGASKFVRGDAVAGLMIVAINVVGGLFIGIVQHGLPIEEAARTYTLLTVGDGLVSQIPALVISMAAGIIVTRAGSGQDLGTEVTSQFLVKPQVLGIVAGILAGFALVPGMPFLAFTSLAAGLGGLAWMRSSADAEKRADEARAAGSALESRGRAAGSPDQGESPALLDVLELEVGYELVPLVDASQRGELVERIRSLRRQLAEELGLLVPKVHIRDNLQRKPGEYAILLKGVEVAHDEVRMGWWLAINPGGADASFRGVPTREPAFGLDALWVADEDREAAQVAGFTVVDPATVVVTHLTEVVRKHAAELLGRQDVQTLLDQLARTSPKAVEELVPQQLSLGGVQKVLQNLLREAVSIRDMLTIVESLADHAPATKDSQALTEHVRQALSRSIVQRYLGADRSLTLVTLAPRVERLVADAIHRTDEGAFLALDPQIAQRLLAKLAAWSEQFAIQGHQPVLLCSAAIRSSLRRVTERFLPNLALLAPGEVPPTVKIHSLGAVTLDDGDLRIGGPAVAEIAA